jgi:anti-sigma factor RsiW
MNCNENRETIGDYVDGTLEHTVARGLEEHLTTCARCRAVVTDLRALRAATRELEPHSAPEHAWARLSRAIEAEQRSRAWLPWRITGVFVWQPLAATAMLAFIVSGLSWLGGHLSLQPPSGAGGDSVASGFSRKAPEIALDGSVDAELQLAEEQYATAIASLEEITRSDTTQLDDHTADVIRSSVEVIDEAIGESRAALEQEPTNQLAQDSLLDALRSKVALLQDTVALMNDIRQDAEASAANGPGLNQ